MATLAQAMAAMKPMFDELVQVRGRDAEFIDSKGAVRVTVRVVEAASWTPVELPSGEVVQQDFDIICRNNEMASAGISRAPLRPDYFMIDGIKRYVEAATPMNVGGTLFGWRVVLSG